jgi:hypothetical protein
MVFIQRRADIYFLIYIEIRLKLRPFAEKRASTRILKGTLRKTGKMFYKCRSFARVSKRIII